MNEMASNALSFLMFGFGWLPVEMCVTGFASAE